MNLKQVGSNMTEVSLAGGLKVLFSYQTPVACIWTNGTNSESFSTEKFWSRTTSRHISQWLGGPAMHKKPQEYFDNLIKEVA